MDAPAPRPGARTYSALSRAFLAAKDFAKAERAARTALEQDAHSAEAHLALANVLHATDMDEAAERELGLALAADPFSVGTLDAAGRLALERGDARGCVEFWRRALALNPWNAALHHDIGGVLGLKLGDWAAVKEHMVKWAELEAMRTEAAD